MTTGEWIEIPESLLSAALRECDPSPPAQWAKAASENPDATCDVPRKLVEAMIEFMSEDLLCDHDVGICMCGTTGIVSELNLALDGKMTCPQCRGEGFDFDADALEAACIDYAKRHGCTVKEARDYIGDDPGYIRCPKCGGNGAVPISEKAGVTD